MQVQLVALAKEIRKLTLALIHNEPHATCDICGREHPTHECQASTEEVNVVGNYNFNAMGQKHPGFSWSSPGGTTNAWQQNNSIFEGAPGFTDERLDIHGAAIKELGTFLGNLERQVGQIATILSERIQRTSVTPIHKEVALEKESRKELKIEDDKKTEKKKEKKGAEKKKKDENSRRDESEESKYMPALPFPQKLYREKLDKQFERFLDMLKQVNVNLPFTEVLSQMPAYAKFLKEILTKKRKIEETSVVKLTEHCRAILQNKLSQKKLENELGEIRSAPISLQLEDQTTVIPEGIVEDALVREKKEVPLILGRPLLAMGRAILDIHDRKHMLRVGEETVTFEMNVAIGVKKEKPLASVEWKVKSSKEKAATSGIHKCGMYPKKG
ncbi:uncharacterized protein [Nicotiana tomentosiformis]|uniref:uncharacterized protein n=1 Tax=Nicotiana tomentosiformis TaxID=4098 RepID=UPI00388CAE0C